MRLTTMGVAENFARPIVGRIAFQASGNPAEDIFVAAADQIEDSVLRRFKALVTPSLVSRDVATRVQVPVVHSVRHHDHFRSGDVIVLHPKTGFVRTIFRPDSPQNALFITDRCNSNCLMCSQPPKDHDDTQQSLDLNLQLIPYLPTDLTYLGITGGEPTLLGKDLFRILTALKSRLPDTDIHMLTNGRTFARRAFTADFAQVAPSRFSVGIPLYSDSATEHDHIVQAKSAFDQTVIGIHELARAGVVTEIRIVLHRLTIPRLRNLAEYICRNFPFVVHVALMGLEPTGYAPRNWKELWIDPVDYQTELEDTVEIFSTRGLNLSIYNSQLCLLRRSLWRYARKSISDWKNIYLPECEACSVFERCGGFFKSGERLHSPNIKSLHCDTI